MTITKDQITVTQEGRSVWVSEAGGKPLVHITLGDNRPLSEGELENLICEVRGRVDLKNC